MFYIYFIVLASSQDKKLKVLLFEMKIKFDYQILVGGNVWSSRPECFSFWPEEGSE